MIIVDQVVTHGRMKVDYILTLIINVKLWHLGILFQKLSSKMNNMFKKKCGSQRLKAVIFIWRMTRNLLFLLISYLQFLEENILFTFQSQNIIFQGGWMYFFILLDLFYCAFYKTTTLIVLFFLIIKLLSTRFWLVPENLPIRTGSGM